MIKLDRQPISEILSDSDLLLRDFFFEFLDPWAQLVIGGFEQPIVQTANMFNRTQTMGRNAQFDCFAERIG